MCACYQEMVHGNIPSHKYIPLMYQLAARLSSEPSDLQTALTQLIVRAGQQHPHHVLPILFSLKAATTDVESRTSVQAECKVGRLVTGRCEYIYFHVYFSFIVGCNSSSRSRAV